MTSTISTFFLLFLSSSTSVWTWKKVSLEAFDMWQGWVNATRPKIFDISFSHLFFFTQMKNWIISDKNLLIFRYLSRFLISTDPESTTILLVLVHICLVCFTLQYFISDAVSRTRGNGKRVRLSTISILCLMYRFLIQRVYKSITSTAAYRWLLMCFRKFAHQLSWLWVVGPVRWGGK